MMRFMLDTNTVSHLIKSHPHVTSRVVTTPIASLCISSITAGELLFGLARRPEATRLHLAVRELLRRVDILPWDDAVAEHYGVLRAEMESQGKVLGPLDLLIAAHAQCAGAVLVTNDKAFASLTKLQLEDWTML